MTALKTSTTRRPRRLRRIAVAATVSFVAVILPLHTAMTFLHVAPVNPVSVAASPVVTSWIYPYFQQNWQLFAPDPVSSDSGVLAQGRVSADGDPTGYVDLSSPTLEARLHNPIPNRLSYVVSGASHSFLTARQEILESLPTDDSAEATPIDKSVVALPRGVLEDASTAQATAYDDALVRLPGARGRPLVPALRKLGPRATASSGAWPTSRYVHDYTGTDPAQVQVRLVTHTFPRWSRPGERHETGLGEMLDMVEGRTKQAFAQWLAERPEPSYSDLPWYDLDSRSFLS